MTPMNKRRVILSICGMPVILIIGLFVWARISGGIEQQEIKPWQTYGDLLYVASRCDVYRQQSGKWPDSRAQLLVSRPELAAPWDKDAWGHDWVLVPYSESVGYGEIISYGRDGKPGGTGLDRDLVARYPLPKYAAWNRQESADLKLPRRLQSDTNWFDNCYNE
jgi:hypothetical protein